jgi:ABC-type Zn uptake system ZnuABC Zn-binding protein ZnuA
VASLSAIGALLATALLVVPAATVRLWTNRLRSWQLATVALTALEGVVGVWLSFELNAPPGATIATLSGAVFAGVALVRARHRITRRRLAAAVAVLALGGAVAGCGAASSGSTNGKPDVVATTTQIGDWARAVGGDDVNVHQILHPNTDPHEYEPRPTDVQAVAKAAIVFTNGDELDHWAGKLVDEAGGSPKVVDLSKSVPDRLPGSKSGPEQSTFDPHWWHDPVNASAAVREIGATLERARPADRRAIARRARAYETRLRALDSQIHACFGKLPRNRLKLVTDHDAFGYFAHRYGLQVVGAVIPSQTTQAQPSARDLSNLAALVRREHVVSIFPESSLSPKLARAIAQETGAAAGLTLYGDTLGPAGSGADTYLRMEAVNARTIALGLSGGRLRCRVGL